MDKAIVDMWWAFRANCALAVTMVGVAKWLTHRIVIPTFVGSIPITHPSDSCKLLNLTVLYLYQPTYN